MVWWYGTIHGLVSDEHEHVIVVGGGFLDRSRSVVRVRANRPSNRSTPDPVSVPQLRRAAMALPHISIDATHGQTPGDQLVGRMNELLATRNGLGHHMPTLASPISIRSSKSSAVCPCPLTSSQFCCCLACDSSILPPLRPPAGRPSASRPSEPDPISAHTRLGILYGCAASCSSRPGCGRPRRPRRSYPPPSPPPPSRRRRQPPPPCSSGDTSTRRTRRRSSGCVQERPSFHWIVEGKTCMPHVKPCPQTFPVIHVARPSPILPHTAPQGQLRAAVAHVLPGAHRHALPPPHGRGLPVSS